MFRGKVVCPNTPSQRTLCRPVPDADAPGAVGDSSPMSLQPRVPVIPLEPPRACVEAPMGERGYSYALDPRPRRVVSSGEGHPFPLGVRAWMGEGGGTLPRPPARSAESALAASGVTCQPGRPHSPLEPENTGGGTDIGPHTLHVDPGPCPVPWEPPPDTPAPLTKVPPTPRAPAPPRGQEGSPGQSPLQSWLMRLMSLSSETSGQGYGCTL